MVAEGAVDEAGGQDVEEGGGEEETLVVGCRGSRRLMYQGFLTAACKEGWMKKH